VPLSIDTSKAAVAHAALERGAILVNDVTALRGDPDIDALLEKPERTLRAMNAGPMLATAHLARASAAKSNRIVIFL